MDLKEQAQTIRETVDITTILDLYGYQVKHGFMVCPFHGDRDASLKIYPGGRGWHCFGCGRGGSVIDFVMEHDACDFKTAVKAINLALRLGLDKVDDPLVFESKRAVSKFLDKLAGILTDDILREKKLIDSQLRFYTKRAGEIQGKPKADITCDEWTELHALNERMQWLEYQLDKADELRREVMTWRRNKQRALTAQSTSPRT